MLQLLMWSHDPLLLSFPSSSHPILTCGCDGTTIITLMMIDNDDLGTPVIES